MIAIGLVLLVLAIRRGKYTEARPILEAKPEPTAT
jgi:hypothetical protein